jgi:hypothetical protein
MAHDNKKMYEFIGGVFSLGMVVVGSLLLMFVKLLALLGIVKILI